MSYDLLRSAKHVRGLSNAEFRVLFYLLEAANNASYECFPSIKKIASFTEMGERTVQRHISALAERGLFERVEQRRNDGSRAVNCYRFVVSGTIKVGRQSVIQLGPDDDDQQPAKNGGLHNRPFSTGGGANSDTTPRQEWRDIDQESEPGFSPPQSSIEEPPIDQNLFGEPVKSAEQIEAERREELIAFVNDRWADLARRFPMIDHATITERRRPQVFKRGNLAAWIQIFEQIERSPFLQGKGPPGKDRDQPFVIYLDWLLGPKNFDKVLGGTYRDKRALAPGFDSRSGRRLTAVEQAVGNVAAGIREGRERRGFGVNRGRADAGAPQLADHRASRD